MAGFVAAVDNLARISETRRRRASYVPKDGNDYTCPVCWIQDGTTSALRPVMGDDTAHWDYWRCKAKNHDIQLPAK